MVVTATKGSINLNILECKYINIFFIKQAISSINLNILECKFHPHSSGSIPAARINLNILECKYRHIFFIKQAISVLI